MHFLENISDMVTDLNETIKNFENSPYASPYETRILREAKQKLVLFAETHDAVAWEKLKN